MDRKDIQLLDDFASQYLDRLGKFIKRYNDVDGLYFIDTIRPSLNYINKTYELMHEKDEVWYNLLTEVYWLTTYADGMENEDEGEHKDWHWLSEIGYFVFNQVNDYYKWVEQEGIEKFKERMLSQYKELDLI